MLKIQKNKEVLKETSEVKMLCVKYLTVQLVVFVTTLQCLFVKPLRLIWCKLSDAG